MGRIIAFCFSALFSLLFVCNPVSFAADSDAAAAQQQSAAASNITETMGTIQSITAQTSQGANQTAASIGNLAQLAADLRRSVADFKLPA